MQVMEKNGWQSPLGKKVLAAYEKVRALSGKERQLLSVLLSYPEKFWKVTNYYVTVPDTVGLGGEAATTCLSFSLFFPAIPKAANMEKLEMLLAQQTQKSEFLEQIISET